MINKLLPFVGGMATWAAYDYTMDVATSPFACVDNDSNFVALGIILTAIVLSGAKLAQVVRRRRRSHP